MHSTEFPYSTVCVYFTDLMNIFFPANYRLCYLHTHTDCPPYTEASQKDVLGLSISGWSDVHTKVQSSKIPQVRNWNISL